MYNEYIYALLPPRLTTVIQDTTRLNPGHSGIGCLASSNLLGFTSTVLLVTAIVALALNLGETVV